VVQTHRLAAAAAAAAAESISLYGVTRLNHISEFYRHTMRVSFDDKLASRY